MLSILNWMRLAHIFLIDNFQNGKQYEGASNDVDSLRSVDAQLRTKLEGLRISSAKASKRRLEVEGQMSMDLEKMAGN